MSQEDAQNKKYDSINKAENSPVDGDQNFQFLLPSACWVAGRWSQSFFLSTNLPNTFNAIQAANASNIRPKTTILDT
jgi:hypothetical protein